MTVYRFSSLNASQSLASSLTSLTSSLSNSTNTHSSNTERDNTLDLIMTDTFYVTPVSELEKLEDWSMPLAFQAAHHHENLDVTDSIEVEWRLRDRV